jgi:DNA processing protein
VPHPFVLFPHDAGWPVSLSALDRPPDQLRILGRLPSLKGAIAIVGTRVADDDALAFTHDLAADLAAEGRTIVSGGAIGVDAAAHRGALSVGGATVVVLPTGFAPSYPEEHRTLFREVVERGGALVTEQPDELAPHPGTFLARNRIIAALAERVVVTQAPFKSGALSTAAAARKLEKPVFAVPQAPWEGRGAGFIDLVRRGALICTSPRDVLSLPALKRPAELNSAAEREGILGDFEGLDDRSRAILGAMGRGARHADALAADLGMALPALLTGLLELELAGRLVRLPDGRYRPHGRYRLPRK